MELIQILLRTNGVFSSVIEKDRKTSDSLLYLGIENDAKNLKNDMRNVYFDVRESTDYAHANYAL